MHAPATKLIPPDILLLAYRSGVFPMADARDDDEVFWVEPRRRAILPLDGFRCSRSLAKVLRQGRYRVTVDADFSAVVAACADTRTGGADADEGTWISEVIEASYRNLHRHGAAHSVECWRLGEQGEELVGGLYGVAVDRLFCGESMFSRADNASKVALAWLVVLLRRAGYLLLDCQFMTGHLASLGAVEVTRERYQDLLTQACADGPALSLPQAYVSLVAEAEGAGAVGAGAGAAAGRAAGASSPASSSSPASGASSGKVIAQSLTHTS